MKRTGKSYAPLAPRPGKRPAWIDFQHGVRKLSRLATDDAEFDGEVYYATYESKPNLAYRIRDRWYEVTVDPKRIREKVEAG